MMKRALLAFAAALATTAAAHAQQQGGGGGGGGGGTGTGCTVSGGAANNIIVDNGSGGCNPDTNAQVSAGALSLGASGTAGSIGIGNAISGTITIQAVSGALGTVTLSLPDATDTLVGRATTDTLANKTLTSPTINGGALSGTFSGNPTFFGTFTLSGAPSTITLNPNNTANYGTFEMVSSVDPSTLSAGTRWFSVQATWAPASNSGNTLQTATLITTLGGTAQQQAELGGLFNNIVINSGATVWASSNVHTDESRFDITGTVSGTAANFLSLANTSSGASIAQLDDFECTHDFASGTVTTAVCLENDAASGSEATNEFLIRNADSGATIGTLGTVTIGSLTPQSSNMLLVIGPDALSTTFPIKVTNSTPSTLLTLNDAGNMALPTGGTLTLGANDSVGGKLQIEMASNTGSVNLVAAAGSTAATVTIPDTTGALASLAAGSAFTVAQTMNAGLTVTGANVSLNASSNFAVNIGTGSTTSTVTLGNSANSVVLAAPVTLSNQSAGTASNYVCTTTGGVLVVQSGAC
jgi:hypothetical protein